MPEKVANIIRRMQRLPGKSLRTEKGHSQNVCRIRAKHSFFLTIDTYTRKTTVYKHWCGMRNNKLMLCDVDSIDNGENQRNLTS